MAGAASPNGTLPPLRRWGHEWGGSPAFFRVLPGFSWLLYGPGEAGWITVESLAPLTAGGALSFLSDPLVLRAS